MKELPGLRVAIGSAESQHRVKGSRFIAVTHPVSGLEQAVDARDVERRRFHDATHHAFAARIAEGKARFDDDGEPTGTAGQPLLRAIDAAGLRDVVVVVTRYYGGTKLGTGGLGRAYGEAAAGALAATSGQAVVRGRSLRVTFRYEDTGPVSRLLDRRGAVRLEEAYAQEVVLEVALPETEVETFRRELVDVTAGRALAVLHGSEMLLPLDT